jgi:hypothetical protein
MRYRDAKDLHNGDQVKRKSDGTYLIVSSTEVFGQYKKVYIHCVDEHNAKVSLYNDEVE